jgi:hypothetical protein
MVRIDTEPPSTTARLRAAECESKCDLRRALVQRGATLSLSIRHTSGVV